MQRFQRCIHISLKSLHFASLFTLVTISYMFPTFVATAPQWNVIDGKSSVRIRRRVEKRVVLKRGENTLLKHSNFSVFLLQVVLFELCIRRSWKLVFTKIKNATETVTLCIHFRVFFCAMQ